MNTAASPSITTTCCVVGGGPAGVVLAYLLARKGIDVTLLEAHKDFDRDFRGDTLHPSTMDLLDALGLGDELLQLPHTLLRQLYIQTPTDRFLMGDFSSLRVRHPYIVLIPQARFLQFLADKGQVFPSFHLRLNANVRELIEEAGQVRGVRFQESGADGLTEIRADLTVACDGRFSTVRKLAHLEPVKSSPPMDVLWIRLPRRPDDRIEMSFRVADGHLLVLLDRDDHWQLGFVILKGEFAHLKKEGIQTLRASLRRLVPELSDRVDTLEDWKQVNPLSVESNRLPQWYKPGLLLLGDAAHVMTPVGGVGINYAIGDAVVAHNLLAGALASGDLHESDLLAVQRQREFPVKVIQWLQRTIQQRLVVAALKSNGDFTIPGFMRIGVVRRMMARMIAYGVRPFKLVD